MKRNGIVAGVDGGATRSVGWLASSEGTILTSAESGSLNWLSSGWPAARRHLARILRFFKAHPLAKCGIDYLVIGSAALNERATNSARSQLCARHIDPSRVELISDVATAWFGASLGRPGILAISGTGSIVVAQQSNLRKSPVKVGGWGHLLGDEGGAYWISIRAIQNCLSQLEGKLSTSSLQQSIFRYFKVRSGEELISAIHQPNYNKDKVASLAAYLAKNATRNHEWRQLCANAGGLLADRVQLAAKLAKLQSPVRCWVHGSVLRKNDIVRKALISKCTPLGIIFPEPELPPELGPLALALRKYGNTDALKNLRKQALNFKEAFSLE